MIYIELFISFFLIGITSFGGMSMIPLIHEQMLSHGWMTAQEVADIVAIAEMTPGPLGLNCATFAGTTAGGALGAFAATFGVLVPTLTITIAAAVFLKKFKESTIMGHALHGIRPVCIGMIGAIVVQQAMINYSGSLLFGISWQAILIGLVSLYLLLKRHFSIPMTILTAAALGLIFCSVAPV
ncbi:MAG: chromate transporter [Clostridia bacterium]|nr:chromate transporter [Clostridia bacterium]